MAKEMQTVFHHSTCCKQWCTCSLVPRPLPNFITAMEKNREKAWDHCYVMDWKWWTRLVRNMHSVCT